MQTLRKIFKNTKGATAIEYGLIAALIAVAAIAAPLLSGCIILARAKPTPRVIPSSAAAAN